MFVAVVVKTGALVLSAVGALSVLGLLVVVGNGRFRAFCCCQCCGLVIDVLLAKSSVLMPRWIKQSKMRESTIVHCERTTQRYCAPLTLIVSTPLCEAKTKEPHTL